MPASPAPRRRPTCAPPDLGGIGAFGESSHAVVNQHFFDARGLDFAYAATIAAELGIRLGEGVTTIHVDEGWHLDHPYLDRFMREGGPAATFGPLRDSGGREEHGTCVLGMHAGGLAGMTGAQPLVPGASVTLASALRRRTDPPFRWLEQAIDQIEPGQPAVMVLARDWSSRASNLPFEVRPGAAELLQRAALRGIVVVQAAGNGGLNLDKLVRRNSGTVRGQITVNDDPAINRRDQLSPVFASDTGAIVAGAVSADLPHARWTAGFAGNPVPKSNFGARIDCSAPGERVFTALSARAGEAPRYTSTFGGTSAAAAIIAAAVAAIQSLALRSDHPGRPLTAAELRTLLRDPSLGRACGSEDERMGSMPNLRAIADALLGNHPVSRGECTTGEAGRRVSMNRFELRGEGHGDARFGSRVPPVAARAG